jgi:hypothetical protein
MASSFLRVEEQKSSKSKSPGLSAGARRENPEKELSHAKTPALRVDEQPHHLRLAGISALLANWALESHE